MLYLYDNLHEAVLLPKGSKLQTNSCKCGQQNSDLRTSSTSVYCCHLLFKIVTTANFECQHTYNKIGLNLTHKMGEKRKKFIRFVSLGNDGKAILKWVLMKQDGRPATDSVSRQVPVKLFSQIPHNEMNVLTKCQVLHSSIKIVTKQQAK